MNSIDTTSVHLTDWEFILLDGQCSPKVQAKVDRAKARLETAQALDNTTMGSVPDSIVSFVTHIVEEAQSNGKLGFSRKPLRHCKVCGEQAGYAKYARNSRYHKRGSPNYNKPQTFQGIELAYHFVYVQGSATVGCCLNCWTKVKPFLPDALSSVHAEIPEAITGYLPKWRRYDNMKCGKCGWEGHKGQMGGLRPVMGHGFYPGQCPKCGAKNLAFGPTIIKTLKGFQVVEA